jgi:very-short-patch-repair endonuclease
MPQIICEHCGQRAVKSVGRYNESIKNGWKFFCSIKCRYAIHEKGQKFSCAWCANVIVKTPAEKRKTKFNVFCNKSCAASFNNRNKTTGVRRSKLEKYLEIQINHDYPDLIVLYNSKKIIGLELDFYFPTLKLAVEFNGHLHFQPIYGVERLQRIQEIDKEKLVKCNEMGIDLRIVDVSREFHLTIELKSKHWQMLKEMLVSRMKLKDYTNP